MDIFDRIAAGLELPPPPTKQACTALSDRELRLSYDLAKKVPDMIQRGFTIETAYGEIVIEPGRHADAVADVVRRALEIQIKAAALACRDVALDGGTQ